VLLAFKFRGADYLAARLAEIVVRRLEQGGEAPGEVTAVPASPRSRRRRGYHPAELLGKAVAARLGLPFAVRLEKVRETPRQSGLPLERRGANVRGAFRAVATPARHILLVDDVATSTWTVRECARVLARAGAERIDVWCFARASRDADFDSGPPPPRT